MIKKEAKKPQLCYKIGQQKENKARNCKSKIEIHLDKYIGHEMSTLSE